MADRKLVEAQHVQHTVREDRSKHNEQQRVKRHVPLTLQFPRPPSVPNVSDGGAKEVGALGEAGADEEAAVRAAVDDDALGPEIVAGCGYAPRV